MRKIFVLIFLYFMLTTSAYAEKAKSYYINFNGSKYDLLYSTKNPTFGGYLNEYYKVGETYHMWSEMVAVHHFPNAFSPIDQVKEFKEYLNSINCPSSLTFDDKKNSAIIDFIMINDSRLPVIMEFNVFKYQKNRKCGSMALQYAKRYAVKTAFEAEAVKKDFEKNRKKAIRRVKNYAIPALVYNEIDKCKLAEDSAIKSENIAATNDVQNESIETNDNSKIIIEDILAQEVITTYKELQFTAEDVNAGVNNAGVNNEGVNNEGVNDKGVNDKGVNTDVTKTLSADDSTDIDSDANSNFKPYDDILNQEVIINYKKPLYAPTAPQANEIIKQENIKIQNDEIMPVNIIEDKKDKKVKVSKKANKNKKQKVYTISNTKDDFYTKPLTKKEIKARNKQLKKEHSKKYLKQRVKNADKKLREKNF